MGDTQLTEPEAKQLVGDALGRATDRLAGLQAQLVQVRKERQLDGSVDDEHDPEGETTSAQWSMLAGRIADVEGEIDELHSAEARISAGDYGLCQMCKKQIALGRLRRRPAATLCIECARRQR